MTSQLILHSKRLILCLPKKGSETDHIKFYQENEEFFRPWDPEKPVDFYKASYWETKIEDAHREFEEEKSLRLNLYEIEGKELVGMINFTSFERGPFQNCRLGYKLGQRFQGQGLMNEALTVGMAYIFEELKFHRIEANYIPMNHRSGNVLKALGFEEHGLARNYLKINGKWQDHLLTSKVNQNPL